MTPRPVGRPSPLRTSSSVAASASLKLSGWLTMIAATLDHHTEAEMALRQLFVQVCSTSPRSRLDLASISDRSSRRLWLYTPYDLTLTSADLPLISH